VSAHVSENDVQVVFAAETQRAGYRSHMGRAYVAYCLDLECCTPEGVGWHGPAHVIGYESAPNAAALDDADEHDRLSHAGVTS
jgi:hypothetical protein